MISLQLYPKPVYLSRSLLYHLIQDATGKCEFLVSATLALESADNRHCGLGPSSGEFSPQHPRCFQLLAKGSCSICAEITDGQTIALLVLIGLSLKCQQLSALATPVALLAAQSQQLLGGLRNSSATATGSYWLSFILHCLLPPVLPALAAGGLYQQLLVLPVLRVPVQHVPLKLEIMNRQEYIIWKNLDWGLCHSMGWGETV